MATGQPLRNTNEGFLLPMSKLEDYLSDQLFTRFGQYSIRRNYYPDWLKESAAARLQLDFYIDELRMAVEVQGEQHYRFIPHFHKDLAGFYALQKRDKDKAYLCEKNGVELYEVFTYTDADLFVCAVKEKQEPDNFWQDPPPNENGVDSRLRLLARKTRRAILRHDHREKANKLVAQLLQKCKDYQAECYIPEIVEYYIANKKDVDFLEKNSKCPYCKDENFFGSLALVQHIEAKHAEKAPEREITPKKPKVTEKKSEPSTNLIGNHKIRNAARKLEIFKRGNEWVLWGGRNTHVIGEDMKCDCGGAKQGNICSHVIRVRFEKERTQDG